MYLQNRWINKTGWLVESNSVRRTEQNFMRTGLRIYSLMGREFSPSLFFFPNKICRFQIKNKIHDYNVNAVCVVCKQ